MQSEKTLEQKKAEAIIKYLIDKVETVEEGDITVEEVVELLEKSLEDPQENPPIKDNAESSIGQAFSRLTRDNPLFERVMGDGIFSSVDNAENRAKQILNYLKRDNSRLKYDDNDVYEIARIIRKKFIRDDDDNAKYKENSGKASVSSARGLCEK